MLCILCVHVCACVCVYPLQVVRRGRQQSLAPADPVASQDAVLAEANFLQPVAHLLRAPLGERDLQVSENKGETEFKRIRTQTALTLKASKTVYEHKYKVYVRVSVHYT